MTTILACAIDEWELVVTACKPNRVERLAHGHYLIRIHLIEGQDVKTVLERCNTQLRFFHGQEEKPYDEQRV